MAQVVFTHGELAAHQQRLVELGLFPPSKCREQPKEYVRRHSAEFNLPAETADPFLCLKLAQKFGPFSIMKGGRWMATKEVHVPVAAPPATASQTKVKEEKKAKEQRPPQLRASVPAKRSASGSSYSGPTIKTTKKTKRMTTTTTTNITT